MNKLRNLTLPAIETIFVTILILAPLAFEASATFTYTLIFLALAYALSQLGAKIVSHTLTKGVLKHIQLRLRYLIPAVILVGLAFSDVAAAGGETFLTIFAVVMLLFYLVSSDLKKAAA